MKHLIYSLILAILPWQALQARNYAYVYIEGDKQTPFYVKIEGQMMPRLGKNYAILPNLDAGVMNMEILFQQSKYPSQKFAIQVPEGGNRGFLLQKVNDRQFALYDLQQGFYVVSGNKAEDDRLPEENNSIPVRATETRPAEEPAVAKETMGHSVDGAAIPAFIPEKKKKVRTEKKQAEPEPESTVGRQQKDRFLDDIELNRGSSAAAEQLGTTADNAGKREEAALKADCIQALSSDEFEDFALKILDKTDDDARIKILAKSKGRKCFTTEQVRIIANNLVTQSGRYDVVKLLYAQTSDKENYQRLESLFKTNFLKSKFREIISE